MAEAADIESVLAHPGLIGLGGARCAIKEALTRSPQISGPTFTGKVRMGWGGCLEEMGLEAGLQVS